MTRIVFSSAALTTILAVLGCSGPVIDVPENTEEPGALPLNGASSVNGAVSVFGFVQTEKRAALPGADVCVLDGNMRCTASRAGGAFALHAVSADSDVLVMFEKEGFTPVLFPMRTGRDNVGLSPAMRFWVNGKSFMGTSANTTQGQLEFLVAPAPSGPATVSVTLTDLDGRTRAPLYLGHDGKPALDATSGFRGGFTDLPTGDYLLTFSGVSAKCTRAGSGFDNGYVSASPVVAPVDRAGESVTLVVPVMEGYLTGPVTVSCTSVVGGARSPHAEAG